MPPTTQLTTQHLTAVCLPITSCTLRPLHWLWPARIPRGKLTLLSGQPEVGKSLLASSPPAVIPIGPTSSVQATSAAKPSPLQISIFTINANHVVGPVGAGEERSLHE